MQKSKSTQGKKLPNNPTSKGNHFSLFGIFFSFVVVKTKSSNSFLVKMWYIKQQIIWKWLGTENLRLNPRPTEMQSAF